MTQLKATPGPWRIADDAVEADFCWWTKADPRCVVVTVDDSPGQGVCATNDDGLATESDIANAHLIAAAPDLYAALADCVESIERMVVRLNSTQPTVAALLANKVAVAHHALAKARGE